MSPLHASVDALLPLLSQHAPDADAQRRLAPEVVDALGDLKLFGLLVPPERGGLGAHPVEAARAVEVVARGCGSAGWTLSIVALSNWLMARGPRRLAAQALLQPGARVALSLSPGEGGGVVEPGGLRLNGRWPWLTGVQHAHWVALTVRVGEAVGVALVRPEHVQVDETWDPVGMRGTGSHDGVVRDVLVPPERLFEYAEVFGPARSDIPHGRLPPLGLFAALNAAVAVGRAVAACDAYAARLTRFPAPRPQALGRLGRARARTAVARAAVHAALAQMSAAPGALPDIGWRLQVSEAVALCQRLIHTLLADSGTRAQHRRSALARAARDVDTLASHVAFDGDAAALAYGQWLFDRAASSAAPSGTPSPVHGSQPERAE